MNWFKAIGGAVVLAVGTAACGSGGATPTSSLPLTSTIPSKAIRIASVSANTNTLVTGTIASFFSGGFTLNSGSPHGMIHIYTSGATTDGPALTSGEQVAITATSGSWSTNWTASDVAPLVGPSRMHTAAYVGSRSSVKAADSIIAPWIDYAQLRGGITEAQKIGADGIKVQLYFDPNLVRVAHTVNGVTTAYPDAVLGYGTPTWATDCSGQPVQFNYKNGESIDQLPIHDSAATINAFLGYLNRYNSPTYAGGTISLLFEDDSVAASAWNNNICGYSDTAWYNAMNTFNSAMPMPLVLNGRNAAALAGNSNVIAMNTENCYASTNGVHDYHDHFWTDVTTAAQQTIAASKTWQCMVNDLSDASTNTNSRMYVLGSFLQTFDADLSLLWENYATPQGLPVMPEAQFVPKYPTGPATIANGMSTRSYRECYYQTKPIGPCEAIVNYTANITLTLPATNFAHSLVLNGYGVVDGGTVTFDGSIPSTLAPETAIVETL